MKTEDYKILQAVAAKAFEQTYAGLYTALRSDKSFPKTIERSYRLNQFSQTHEFFMTANERQFHLMGFVDAIIGLGRMGYFNSINSDEGFGGEDDCELETEEERAITAQLEKETEKEREAIFNAFISFETGEG